MQFALFHLKFSALNFINLSNHLEELTMKSIKFHIVERRVIKLFHVSQKPPQYADHLLMFDSAATMNFYPNDDHCQSILQYRVQCLQIAHLHQLALRNKKFKEKCSSCWMICLQFKIIKFIEIGRGNENWPWFRRHDDRITILAISSSSLSSFTRRN